MTEPLEPYINDGVGYFINSWPQPEEINYVAGLYKADEHDGEDVWEPMDAHVLKLAESFWSTLEPEDLPLIALQGRKESWAGSHALLIFVAPLLKYAASNYLSGRRYD